MPSDSSGDAALANPELLKTDPNNDVLKNIGLVTFGTSPAEAIIFNGEEITSLGRALKLAEQQADDNVAKLKKSIEDTRQAQDERTKNRAEKAARITRIKGNIQTLGKLLLEIDDKDSNEYSSMKTLYEQFQMSLYDSDFDPVHSEDINSQLLVKINKLEEDVRKLQRKSRDRQRDRNGSAAKTKELMGKLGIGQKNEADEKTKPVLTNQSRRDICFHYDDRSGLYIYPWEAKKRRLFPVKKNSAELDEQAEKIKVDEKPGLVKPKEVRPRLNKQAKQKRFNEKQQRLLQAKKNNTELDQQAEKIKFDEFILANCLFGASLLGVDAAGKKYPMIDHDLKVDSIIERIEVVDNNQLHPYEVMMFASFDKLAALMHHTGNKHFVVRYHLPVVDYMLYGLHTYIIGVMSFAAFDEYIKVVKERGIIHSNILTALARKNNLNLLIESPFDNFASDISSMSAEKLLGLIRLDSSQLARFKAGDGATESSKTQLQQLEIHFSRQRKDLCDFQALIDTLATVDDFGDGRGERVGSSIEGGSVQALPVSKEYTPSTYEIRMLLEKLCIENILKRLRGTVPSVFDGKKSCHNQMHADIWNEIERNQYVTSYDPLSKLFQVANTTLLALRSGKTKCSLLPIDEKPIPESYQKIFSEHFGNITCLSWLPPVNNCYNSSDDLARNKSNYINNLFRLRTDLYAIDKKVFRRQVAIAMKLGEDFWDVLAHFSSSESQNLSEDANGDASLEKEVACINSEKTYPLDSEKDCSDGPGLSLMQRFNRSSLQSHYNPGFGRSVSCPPYVRSDDPCPARMFFPGGKNFVLMHTGQLVVMDATASGFTNSDCSSKGAGEPHVKNHAGSAFTRTGIFSYVGGHLWPQEIAFEHPGAAIFGKKVNF